MEIIKQGYYYLFYKLYKFWDYISVPKFWSDVKASLSIDLLVLFTIASIFFYLSFENKTLFLTCLILMLFISNYFLLKDVVWKDYSDYFDKLPKSKNRNATIIVWSIIVLIIINFIYSIYWMDRRAQYNKTGPYSKEYMNN